MQYVQYEIRAGVAEIALDRPAARNALSAALLAELDRHVENAQADAGVRVILLHGSGKHFCAGADLQEILAINPDEAREQDYIGSSLALQRCELPVICAVEGYALGGGCELVEMCDIVIAGETAKFGHPELKMATMSGAGGIQRLVRAIGKAAAMDVLLTGRMLHAHEALLAGLVSRMCQSGQALGAAREIAETVSRMPPVVARSIKRDAQAAFELPLSEGLRLEKELFHGTLADPELRKRIGRFLEKSKSAGDPLRSAPKSS
jgi:enoyl-CoA hydratase